MFANALTSIADNLYEHIVHEHISLVTGNTYGPFILVYISLISTSGTYMPGIVIFDIHYGHSISGHSSRVYNLGHSYPALSNMAFFADIDNLGVFPGYIFFGHISRA